VEQHTHNTLVTVSVAKEHLGAFWNFFVYRFVVLLFPFGFCESLFLSGNYFREKSSLNGFKWRMRMQPG
jgi:hypothetical protein